MWLLSVWISMLLLIFGTDAISKDPCYFWPGSQYANGKCFVIGDLLVNVSDAQNYCTNDVRGGKLAEPKSQDEFDAILRAMQSPDVPSNGNYYYIGMAINESDKNVYNWMSDGQLVEDVNSWWGNGQPGPSDLELCVVISSGKDLHDVTCDLISKFVCEYYVGNPCDHLLPGGVFFNGRCFLTVNETDELVPSQRNCLEMVAILAEPKDEATRDFLRKQAERHFIENNVTGFRIGGFVSEETGNWTWYTTNEMIEEKDWAEPPDEKDKYIVMRRFDGNWKWAGTKETSWAYICQRDIGDACEGEFPGGVYSFGSCVKLFTTQTTWNEAKEACKEHNSFLVEPANESLSFALDRYLSYMNVSSVWLGGTDEKEEGTFLWDRSQKEFTYTNWHDGDPNNAADREDYVIWLDNGWVDVSLDYENVLYACQKNLLARRYRSFYVILPALAMTQASVKLVQITTSIRTHPVYIKVSSSVEDDWHDYVTSAKSKQIYIKDEFDLEMSVTGIDRKYLAIASHDVITIVVFIKHPFSTSTRAVLPRQWMRFHQRGQMYFIPAASDEINKDNLVAVTAMQIGPTNVTIYQPTIRGGSGLTSGDIHYFANDRLVINAILDHHHTTMLSRDHFGLDGSFLQSNRGVAVLIGKTQNSDTSGDHSMAQVLPIDTIGNKYITFPSFPADNTQDNYRFIAVFDNTIIKIHYGAATPDNIPIDTAGEVKTVPLKPPGFHYIESDKNFYVLKSSEAANGSHTKSCITSLFSQNLWDYQFAFDLTVDFQGYEIYVVVILEASELSLVRWNTGVGLASPCSDVPGTTMKGCIYKIEQVPFYYQLYLENFQAKFMAYMHGSDGSSAFCHPLGYANPGYGFTKFDPEPYLNRPRDCYINEITTASVMPQDDTGSTVNITNTTAADHSWDLNPETTQATVPFNETKFAAQDKTPKNVTSEEVENAVKEIEEHLRVDAKSTSAFKRTKISVEDKRVSSTFLGVGGMIFVIIVASLFVLSDILSFLGRKIQ